MAQMPALIPKEVEIQRLKKITPAHWWLYSHFIALPLGWGFVAMYDRRVPILRRPNNSMNTGLKLTILGYHATMFTMSYGTSGS
jgi:methane/ammonia monooxygenase subunit C